ncbi:MAG: putative Ig domain-containing protein [Woeseiaceae bacterium]
MRNTVVVVICTAIMGGCLESVETNALQDDLSGVEPPQNTNPTIAGRPDRAVLYTNIYQFRPDATDADGDKLTFVVENKPEWANFDTASGALYGQPDSAAVGVYDNIVISVSDGVGSDSLPPFSITVSTNAVGNITLNWAPPTENSDGTPLTDLAGYFIYVGEESGVYLRKIRIRNSGATSYVVDNLLPDTYYFAASSFNSAGVESELSLETASTVN